MVLTDRTAHMVSVDLSKPFGDLLGFLFKSDSAPVSAGAPYFTYTVVLSVNGSSSLALSPP